MSSMLNQMLNHLKYLSLLLMIPIVHVFYTLLNNGNRGATDLSIFLDQYIPFLKIFIIPYIVWYFFIFLTLTYFCLKDRAIYLKTLIAYIISLFVCYLFYYFYQTTMVRPEVVGQDILSKLVGLIYANDEPYNLFPSIHVLSSFLMIMAIHHSSIKTRLNHIIISSQAWVIIASTVFVKQHVVLDIAGAIVLGFMVFKIVYHYETIVSYVQLYKGKPISVRSAKNQRYYY